MEQASITQIATQASQVEQLQAIAREPAARLQSMQVRAPDRRRAPGPHARSWASGCPGTTLAKVAQPGGSRPSCASPRRRRKDVALGQPAEDRHAQRHRRRPRACASIPPCRTARCSVDVALDGELPPGARPDLSVDGTIEIERLPDVLYVGRPAYGQSESTVGLFKLDAERQGRDPRAGGARAELGERDRDRAGPQRRRPSDPLRHERVQHNVDARSASSDNHTFEQTVHAPDARPRRQHRLKRHGDALISLHGIKKVFLTDEVETHALAGVHFDDPPRRIRLDLAARRAAASRRCSRSSACSTRRARASTLLNGEPVARPRRRERARIRNRQIGFVFQAFNLIGDLTVFENVELPLTYRTAMPASERKRRACRRRSSASAWRIA